MYWIILLFYLWITYIFFNANVNVHKFPQFSLLPLVYYSGNAIPTWDLWYCWRISQYEAFNTEIRTLNPISHSHLQQFNTLLDFIILNKLVTWQRYTIILPSVSKSYLNTSTFCLLSHKVVVSGKLQNKYLT